MHGGMYHVIASQRYMGSPPNICILINTIQELWPTLAVIVAPYNPNHNIELIMAWFILHTYYIEIL